MSRQTLRGLRTLAVRIERQAQTAGEVAALLDRHPAVRRACYPGLPSTPAAPSPRGGSGGSAR